MGEGSLKPCPFCGGAAVLERRPWALSWAVLCGNPKCNCAQSRGATADEARAMWNRRYTPAILFGHDGTTGGTDDPNG